jgi:hypothetical protein
MAVIVANVLTAAITNPVFGLYDDERILALFGST